MPAAAAEPDEAIAAPSPGMGGVLGLLAAGAIEGAGCPDERAVHDDAAAAGQGRALLGALAGLQLAALGGGQGEGGAAARQRLADLAQALPQAGDKRLDDVLRAIAQRAAIELAREG